VRIMNGRVHYLCVSIRMEGSCGSPRRALVRASVALARLAHAAAKSSRTTKLQDTMSGEMVADRADAERALRSHGLIAADDSQNTTAQRNGNRVHPIA